MLHVLNTIFCVIGSDLVEGYENLSINRSEFEGQSVLILGRGNSAFETAQHILGSTNFVHMVSRDRVKLSWSTHYVGDLRAVNNGLLDTYQLKSLDGTFESIRLFHSLLRYSLHTTGLCVHVTLIFLWRIVLLETSYVESW